MGKMWSYTTIACGMRCLTSVVVPIWALVWKKVMDIDHTRPADILIAGWDRDNLLHLTSPSHHPSLLPYCSILMDPNASSWASPAFHWQWRHIWQLGQWGPWYHLQAGIPPRHSPVLPKSSVVAEIYGWLNMALILFIARAILFNIILTMITVGNWLLLNSRSYQWTICTFKPIM